MDLTNKNLDELVSKISDKKFLETYGIPKSSFLSSNKDLSNVEREC
jgi:hypothetical protein